MELIAGGSVISGATPSSLLASTQIVQYPVQWSWEIPNIVRVLEPQELGNTVKYPPFFSLVSSPGLVFYNIPFL